jgi:uroporphyrinogen-III decarboxylase
MKKTRDWLKAYISGEKNLPVPQYWMSYFNSETARKLTPAKCHYAPAWLYDVGPEFDYSGMDEEALDSMIEFNTYNGRCMVALGKGANLAFGHGGPGEFVCRMIERENNHIVVEYETGVKTKVQFKPHFYHIYDHPVKSIADVENLRLPDPFDDNRYIGLKRNTKYLRQKGQFVTCSLNGFFSGIHYFLYEYQQALMAMLTDEDLIFALLEKIGNWNLAAAGKIAECEVDSICLCDDLGAKQAMLMSPDIYRKFFKPWHKRLCDLMHEKGVLVHLHSHGAITPILDDLVDCGFDIINPFDPEEGFDIEQILSNYSRHFVVVGGMPASFWEWQEGKREDYIEKMIKLARRYGKYIIMDSGGIPENVAVDDYNRVLDLSRRLRGVDDLSCAV